MLGYSQGIPNFVNPTKIVCYESPLQAITPSNKKTITHNLGGRPTKPPSLTLICQTAEHGYTIGDEVLPTQGYHSTAGTSDIGGSISWDDDNIYITFGSNSAGGMYKVFNQDTGAGATITNANWKVKVYAELQQIGDIPDITRVSSVPLKSGRVNNEPSLDIALHQYFSNYELFELNIYDLHTYNSTALGLRVSTDQGTTFKTSGYNTGYYDMGGSKGGSASSDVRWIIHQPALNSSSNQLGLLNIQIPNPQIGSQHTTIGGQLWMSLSAGSAIGLGMFAGRYPSGNDPFTDIRLLADTGNIDCKYTLIGKQKAA